MVVIALSEPQADFPSLVSNPFNVIYPKKVLSRSMPRVRA